MIVVSIGVAFALTRIFGYKDGESQPQTVSGNETVQEVPVINETAQENANVVVKHFVCHPRLIWGSVVVVAVRAYMVVCNIGEFFHRLVQFFLCPGSIRVGAFILQRVEITLHRRIIIWIPCLAHTLNYVNGL